MSDDYDHGRAEQDRRDEQDRHEINVAEVMRDRERDDENARRRREREK